jgi:hypothetical protein
MSDALLRMLATAQEDERAAIRRGDDDVLRLIRNRIANLETLLLRRGEQ